MRAKTKDESIEEQEEEGDETPQPEKKSQAITIRINPKLLIAVIVVVVLGAGLFFAKNIFLAATVNGKLITRFTVIKELEKRSGKQALESLITQRLVDAELTKKNVTVSDGEVQEQIGKIEQQITQQGNTLQVILDQQGMTRDELVEQIRDQKRVEKLFVEEQKVSDQDVEKYMKDNGITVPEGKDPKEFATGLKEQVKQQKLETAINTWITNLRQAATIRYFTAYP